MHPGHLLTRGRFELRLAALLGQPGLLQPLRDQPNPVGVLRVVARLMVQEARRTIKKRHLQALSLPVTLLGRGAAEQRESVKEERTRKKEQRTANAAAPPCSFFFPRSSLT